MSIPAQDLEHHYLFTPLLFNKLKNKIKEEVKSFGSCVVKKHEMRAALEGIRKHNHPYGSVILVLQEWLTKEGITFIVDDRRDAYIFRENK